MHLAELGSVQLDALPTLAAYFGIDLRAYTDLRDRRTDLGTDLGIDLR